MKKKRGEGISPRRGSANLGTFSGVFTPSILTILGIILFLRLGYVLGSAGLGRTLLIIGFACAISVLTSISLSAIATNIKVKRGGDYYLISRTLGMEFGGAIGVVLFLAQSVSIAFYCIGFGETVAGLLPEAGRFPPQVIAALAVAFLFVFAWLGADWATRLQYVIMSVLGAALVSFFIGGADHWDSSMLAQNWSAPAGAPHFWILFAIFFPAVTGFTQGVSMSGDLKDASKSLPLGTFLAVGLSTVVYLLVTVVLAAGFSGEELAGDYSAMNRMARVGWLIQAGVIAATLSSGMASFLGAPRILQALSGDRIFPFLLPFARGAGPANNPRRGVMLSAGIAFATISLGELNVIAPVVSMFFLISYGLLNYATFFEARASSPSFRPRFRFFHSRLSLCGGICCLGAMFAIDAAASAAGIAILFAIYQYLKRTEGPMRWADSRRSYHFQQVRAHLLDIAPKLEHPRDWRPPQLVFSREPRRREQLLCFSSWIEGGSGFTTAAEVLVGEGGQMRDLREEAEAKLRADIAKLELKAFAMAVSVPDFYIGVQTLVQSFGIGPVRANTILINWLEQLPTTEDQQRERSYGRHLRAGIRLGCNMVLLDSKEEEWERLRALSSGKRRIDVWWRGDATSRLMLLLAYLMTRNEEWDGAKIRVLASGTENTSEKTLESLRQTMEEVRIDAEPEVVVKINADKIVERSSESALVFLPFRLRGNQPVGPFGGRLEELLARLPIVSLVLAAEDIELDAEPEEGKIAEVAAALDAVEDTEKKARNAEKKAAKVASVAEKKIKKAQDAVTETVEEGERAQIENEARQAQKTAVSAEKKAEKAREEAEKAAKEAEVLGARTVEEEEDE